MKKKSKVLTRKQCSEMGLYCYSYLNGDYDYRDQEGYFHLIRNDDDLLKGKYAKGCWSYENGDYAYEDSEGYWHLIRDGVDLLEGKGGKGCKSYDNGDYEYKDSEGKWYYIKKEPKKLD